MLLLGLLTVTVMTTITMIVFSIGSNTNPSKDDGPKLGDTSTQKEKSSVSQMTPIPTPSKKAEPISEKNMVFSNKGNKERGKGAKKR